MGETNQTSAVQASQCQWCGMSHGALCPMVKAIEYHPNGTMKRVEFKSAADYPPIETGPAPFWQNPVIA